MKNYQTINIVSFSVIILTSFQAMATVTKNFVTNTSQASTFPFVTADVTVPLCYDGADYKGVIRGIDDLQADIERVTGRKPEIMTDRSASGYAVIIGTLGKSKLIDGFVASGKLDVKDLKGKWESFVITTLDKPESDIDQALVIAGSDRRGTIYGIYELSEQLGVSPWYWWADVPPKKRTEAYIIPGRYASGEPAVKYRGIFINDEDWGLHQWSKQTLEPETGGIGPKTYEKVFELLLRLRLNYIWPAMHECTREFASIPENVELADLYGIVAGASHCEPMLFNNAKWNERERGRWNYTLNRDGILNVWEDYAKTRGDKEAVWGIGIRGIHDRGMQGPNDTSQRIGILGEVFTDQRALLDKYVTKEWGPVSQAFVPYKEVLTLYDAGLQVPDDVTLVWVDDNFGYIRRLSNPEERKRSGGAGVYYHISYYGGPHSYLWINSTAPAHIWEELHKAWENDARTLWVLNVGDIKPAEIGIDYFTKFAWNVEEFGPDSQPRFLRTFTETLFEQELAEPIAAMLTEYYRLGTIRKPELMSRPEWAIPMPEQEAVQLREDYKRFLETEAKIAAEIPADSRDAYTEMIGFPARVLGATGLIFMADRAIQFGDDVEVNEKEIERLRNFLDSEVDYYNNEIADGKWKHMMPGAVTARNLTQWNSQVRWPWGETSVRPVIRKTSDRTWRAAASADRQLTSGQVKWVQVDGLGTTGKALALKPAGLESSWDEDDTKAPTLEYDFRSAGGDAEVLIDFLPAFRIYPGMKLRVAVSVDDKYAEIIEVPGSSGSEDESGRIRNVAVQTNYVRATVRLPGLTAGQHILKIRAVDPGAVIDRISLPDENAGKPK